MLSVIMSKLFFIAALVSLLAACSTPHGGGGRSRTMGASGATTNPNVIGPQGNGP